MIEIALAASIPNKRRAKGTRAFASGYYTVFQLNDI